MIPVRTVLVHYHIFKNAGTSVDANLKASFGSAWGEFEGTHAHDIQSSDRLAEFLRNNQHLLAVSSHLARPPLPRPDCLPVVFLRHPLLRARSVYHFTRHDPAQPFADAARELTFADYIRWALNEEPGSIVIRDYQVVHLSDASFRCENILQARAGQADLTQACNLISSWGAAGIVERFPTSMNVFQKLYGTRLPSLNLQNIWCNRTAIDDHPTEEKIDRVRSSIGDSLYDEFMQVNALDLKLYEHSNRVLDDAAERLHVAAPHAAQSAA